MTSGPSLLAWRRLPAALALAAGLQAYAAADAPSFDLEGLMASLAAVHSARAHFVERKYLSVLKQPLEVSGTLIYTAPSHLEKNTLLPRPERLVVDGDELTFERDQGHERRTLSLQEYPDIWAFVESIRATLAGDLATLERFYVIDVSGGPHHWRLVLVPRETPMHALVSAVTITGRDSQVDTVEIQEADGDRSVLSVERDP
jgi:hypothetical protein